MCPLAMLAVNEPSVNLPCERRSTIGDEALNRLMLMAVEKNIVNDIVYLL